MEDPLQLDLGVAAVQKRKPTWG